jgi:D-serine deaminase-like pyridoxal phosphate-dependent protein
MYELADPSGTASPALLYYPEIIRANTARAVGMAGSPERLWPHVKTHKLAEIVRIQQEAGIGRYKCATAAEAEILGGCGVQDILLAYPLVGPAIPRFLLLMQNFRLTGWWAIGDSDAALAELDRQAHAAGLRPNVLIDVNMGMDRTGVPLREAEAFYRAQAKRKNLRVRGFHGYDGHIRDADPALRNAAASPAAESVLAARERLLDDGYECGAVVLGGTPTFPCHTGRADAFLSPGTLFVHDHGHAGRYRDLPFTPAAAILTRVISLPGEGLFTLDLGHKAIAADPPGARGAIVSLPGAVPVSQSEEHWVWRFGGHAPMPRIGDALYVIPSHICPTAALYAEVYAVRDGRIAETWDVRARNRKITI